jgi:hypothetical protein
VSSGRPIIYQRSRKQTQAIDKRLTEDDEKEKKKKKKGSQPVGAEQEEKRRAKERGDGLMGED